VGCGLAALGACTIEVPRRADTVRVVDTVARVDTVIVVDTVVSMGDAGSAGDTGRVGGGTITYGAVPLGDATAAPPGTPIRESDLAYLRSRHLIIPVAGVGPDKVPDTFNEMRGSRRHNASDIPAPRGTPVLSADSGRLVKLHTSVAGGLTIYATDPRGRFIYFYAHLDRYRPGLVEGMPLARGDTIGFVGTTGNAPPNVPHLHFAIARVDSDRKWWTGTPLDPRPLLVASGARRYDAPPDAPPTSRNAPPPDLAPPRRPLRLERRERRRLRSSHR
jgi:hypothetical protein